MFTNTKNPALTKTTKKEKERSQTRPDGCITLQSNICPIVTVKSFGSSIDCKTQVELNSHADTSLVGFNILVVHYHDLYVEFFGYDSKSRHKYVTTVNAAVASDNPQTGDMSVLLNNQAILIPSIKNILLCPMQCCLNSDSVNYVTKFLMKNPIVNDHAVIILFDIDD